jgi:hypothetical protein
MTRGKGRGLIGVNLFVDINTYFKGMMHTGYASDTLKASDTLIIPFYFRIS